MNSDFKNKGVYSVFSAVLLLNTLLFICLKNQLPPVTDFLSSYSPLAVNLLSGKGFTIEGIFCSYYPPLFPLLLAACYKLSGVWNIENAIYPAAIVLMQSLSCAIFYHINFQLVSRRSAVWSALLLALYPFFIVLTATRYAWNAMPLCLFFFAGSLACFFPALYHKKAGNILLSGLLLGFAGLTWGGMAYALLPFLIYMAVFHRKEKKTWVLIFCFAAGFLMPTASWSLYASHKTGTKVFISSAASGSMADGLVRHEYSKFKNYATVRRAREKRDRGEIKNSRDIFAFYGSEIKNFPLDFLKWSLYKASRAWYGTDSEKHEALNFLAQAPYILCGLYGLFLFAGAQKKETWLFLGLIFYFWSVSFLVLTTIRYMMPAFMLWMIFAGRGAEQIFKKITHK